MIEIRRGMGEASGSERLPWLEPVEDEDFARQPGEPGGYGGVVVTIIAVLVGITLLTAAIVWYRHHRAANADIGGIIAAPAGPYKVKPPEAGGLKTDQVGEVASGTGAGEDIDGMLDLGALPEQPMIKRGQPGRPPQPANPEEPAAPPPVPAAATPASPKPPMHAPIPSVVAPPSAPAIPPAALKPGAPATPAAPAAPTGGGAIQLGAFSSEAKAKAAWKGLSGRFAFLRDMTMIVQPVKSGDNTLYRLRANNGDAPARLCARLKIAGETCAVPND